MSQSIRRALSVIGAAVVLVGGWLAGPSCSSADTAASDAGVASGGQTCDHSIVHNAKCNSDTDCLSGNCFEGGCYVGSQNCTSNADCQALAPSAAYLGSCFNDSTKHGCAFYCR